MAERRKRVLGSLVSRTYHPDPLICWRAVEAMGGREFEVLFEKDFMHRGAVH